MFNYQPSDFIKGKIKAIERFSAHAYLDPAGNTAGKHSIGYGHQIVMPTEKALLTKTITEQEANLLFDNDLRWRVTDINKKLKQPVSQYQGDAILDFHFNIGNADHIIDTWNTTKDTVQVANRMALYNHANGVVDKGLVARRSFEGQLFQNLIDQASEKKNT